MRKSKKTSIASRSADVDRICEVLRSRNLRITATRVAIANAIMLAAGPMTAKEVRTVAGRALMVGYKVSQPTVSRMMTFLEREGFISITRQVPTYARV